MTEPTPRYSICTPGNPPTEVLATNSRQNAFALCAHDELVYDWTTGKTITNDNT